MATDERNFRSAYYEKVGFRSVEEKRSLEILLKDKPLDRGKLKQFCLRFCVPAAYRNLLWKVLLGIVPVHVDCHDFIMSQRKQEYNDLVHALHVMRVIDSNTPKSQVFLAVWALQTRKFTYHFNLAQFSLNNKVFLAIVQSLEQFFNDDTDVYWLALKFYENKQKYHADFLKLSNISCGLLEKEEPELYKHIQSIGGYKYLPIIDWFYCCFAGILTEAALAKIWDKLCGGSCKILVYVVVVLFSNLKHRLLKCSNLTSVTQCINTIPVETADVIANKSIEMWQHHGSPLTLQDKPKP